MGTNAGQQSIPLRSWMWAALWSSVFTAIFVETVLNNGSCVALQTVHQFGFSLCVWLWLLVFFVLRDRARVFFVVISGALLAASIVIPDLHTNIPKVESSVVLAMHEANESLQTYRRSHAGEGYPQYAPAMRSRLPITKYYTFIYTREQSGPHSEFDRYTLAAVPCRRDCGFARSFALTEDGRIFYTSEERPATRNDTSIDTVP